MVSQTLAILLLALSALTTTHCYVCVNIARRSSMVWATGQPILAMGRTIRMKIRDDTVRAAEAERARKEEEARLAAEAAADPEPGPCIECGDHATYWDGMVTFACTKCGHEWGIEEAKAAAEESVTRDVNGAELSNGDQVVLIKDLAGGRLKKGLKVKIRLGDFGDNHDLQTTIPSQGTYALKSEFVKKGSQ